MLKTPLHRLRGRTRGASESARGPSEAPVRRGGNLEIDVSVARAVIAELADLRAQLDIPTQTPDEEDAVVITIDHDIRLRGERLPLVLDQDQGLQKEAQVTTQQAVACIEQFESARDYYVVASEGLEQVRDSRRLLGKGQRDLHQGIDSAIERLIASGTLPPERLARLQRWQRDIVAEQERQQAVTQAERERTQRRNRDADEEIAQQQAREQRLRDILNLRDGEPLEPADLAEVHELLAEHDAPGASERRGNNRPR